MDYLSTGQAAKLLSVTTDTVLKWIKRGRIPAVRTAGGHYRISSTRIQSMLRGDRKEALRPAAGYVPEEKDDANGLGPFVHCWEFFSVDGQVRQDCLRCVAYKAKAEKCYELSQLSEESGFQGIFCKASCEKCPYYVQQASAPLNILIISDRIERQLAAREQDSSRLKVRFASCEYECSLLVDTFRPDFVILDCGMNLDKSRELCEHLRSDPRIPGVRIITVVPPHVDKESLEFCDGTICIRLEKTVPAETIGSWIRFLTEKIG
jgi:excisionase family DNA binding protein